MHLAAHEYYALGPDIVFVRPGAVAVGVHPGCRIGKLQVAKVLCFYHKGERQYALYPFPVFYIEIPVAVDVEPVLHRLFEDGDVLRVYYAVLVSYTVAVDIRPSKVGHGDRPSETRDVKRQNRYRIHRIEKVLCQFDIRPVQDAVTVKVGTRINLISLFKKLYVGVINNAIRVNVGKRFFFS